MTLDKAIEIQHDHVYHPDHHHDLDTQNAMLLGIEALKRFKFARNHPSGWELEPLPGEDPE